MPDTILIFTGIVLITIGIIIGLLITQAIWNYTMPEVFGLKQITFLQTLGLVILANIFFKTDNLQTFYNY